MLCYFRRVRAISLDLISRRLDKGLYRRRMRSKMTCSCALNERVNCRELTPKSLKIRSNYNRILSSNDKIIRNCPF